MWKCIPVAAIACGTFVPHPIPHFGAFLRAHPIPATACGAADCHPVWYPDDSPLVQIQPSPTDTGYGTPSPASGWLGGGFVPINLPASPGVPTGPRVGTTEIVTNVGCVEENNFCQKITTNVPEPASWLLFFTASLLVVLFRYGKKNG